MINIFIVGLRGEDESSHMSAIDISQLETITSQLLNMEKTQTNVEIKTEVRSKQR